MLPGTAAGGSERAEGQRALIAPGRPQGQPQTPYCSHTTWRGFPRPHSHQDPPPCPLVPCPATVMQLRGSSSPTASPTPPLLIRVCLPTAWKGQEGSPNSVKCRTINTNPPKVRTSALHNTPDTVLHCPTTGSSPHIHLLPSTLDPSHLNFEGQPPTEMPHEAAYPMSGPSQPREKGTGQVPHCQPCWLPQFPRVQLV